MWLKAQNEMAGFWPHVAMGPVERLVRRYLLWIFNLLKTPSLKVIESRSYFVMQFRPVKVFVQVVVFGRADSASRAAFFIASRLRIAFTSFCIHVENESVPCLNP